MSKPNRTPNPNFRIGPAAASPEPTCSVCHGLVSRGLKIHSECRWVASRSAVLQAAPDRAPGYRGIPAAVALAHAATNDQLEPLS